MCINESLHQTVTGLPETWQYLNLLPLTSGAGLFKQTLVVHVTPEVTFVCITASLAFVSFSRYGIYTVKAYRVSPERLSGRRPSLVRCQLTRGKRSSDERCRSCNCEHLSILQPLRRLTPPVRIRQGQMLLFPFIVLVIVKVVSMLQLSARCADLKVMSLLHV